MQALYEAVRARDRSRANAAIEADPSLAIFGAAIFGDADAIESLLAANRTLVSAISADGWTPLHLAAHFGKEDAARVLLNKGAGVNALSSNALRNTPLHAAAAGRAVAVARLLIERGANVNARQHSGWTPLHAAAQNGDLELAMILLENAAEAGVRAENQQTPLDLALLKGHQSMVELLELSAGPSAGPSDPRQM